MPVTVQCECEMGRARSSGSGEPAPRVSCLARGAPTPLPLEMALGSLPSPSLYVSHNQKGAQSLRALACLLQERKVTSTTSKSRERFLAAEWWGKVKVRRDWPGVR